MRLAYIASRYPLVSHTFILREVLALRRAGVEVHTFSVRRSGDEQVLSRDDRDAYATTWALLPTSARQLFVAHLSAFARSPSRYMHTLGVARSMRARGARAAVWQLFYFGEAALMWRECRRRGIRHIHAQHANVASDVALLAATLGGDGWSWSFTMHGPTELFDVREHRLAEKTRRAQFVVCISDYARSQIMALTHASLWDRLHVVRCGIDLTRFEPTERTRTVGVPEILSVGRAVPVKGQALLIAALAELVDDRGLEAVLTLAGDGPELPALRAQAQRLGVADLVTFAGATGQDEIGSFYQRAAIFALPSFAEGLPVVLMEAMATGLPVVASRITGVPELVEEGVSGLLVAPGRVDELAEALARLLSETPERRAEMGRAGRTKVAAEFDIERSARELVGLFEAEPKASPDGAATDA